MATNDFLVFGGGASANVITQVTYSGLTARTAGFSAGVAQSAQLNKVWRQSSIMSAVLAQFIVDRTGLDALDDGTTATLLANMKTAVDVTAVGRIKTVKTTISTTSGTYTPSAGMAFVLVEGCGGGGAGGGAVGGSGTGSAGGGGAAGGMVRKIFTAAQIGASQSYTVGSAGAGVVGGNGGAGGTSTFGSGGVTLTANGGTGGSASVASTAVGATGAAGVGGQATGGDDNVQGYPGSFGLASGSNGGTGGVGGSGWFGCGGAVAVNTTGNIATGAGAGGGGAGAQATSLSGGVGSAGKWKFTEFLTQ